MNAWPSIRAADPLLKLARAGGWSPGRILAVMDGYFDESGEHAPGGSLTRLTVGGFFAPLREIERLNSKWGVALDAEGLSAFHMKEIASDEGGYPTWAPERRRRLDRFVDILCECAAEFGAFSYVPRNPARAFADAYEPAISRVMIVAASLSERTGERGNVVFAQTDEIKQEMIGRYFDRLRWAEWLDGYSVLSSRHSPALQAAEIVARGLKRVMQDGGVTQSFAKILTAGKPCRFWPEQPLAAAGFAPRLLGVVP